MIPLSKSRIKIFETKRLTFLAQASTSFHGLDCCGYGVGTGELHLEFRPVTMKRLMSDLLGHSPHQRLQAPGAAAGRRAQAQRAVLDGRRDDRVHRPPVAAAPEGPRQGGGAEQPRGPAVLRLRCVRPDRGVPCI